MKVPDQHRSRICRDEEGCVEDRLSCSLWCYEGEEGGCEQIETLGYRLLDASSFQPIAKRARA